jgi:hypothetical protein
VLEDADSMAVPGMLAEFGPVLGAVRYSTVGTSIHPNNFLAFAYVYVRVADNVVFGGQFVWTYCKGQLAVVIDLPRPEFFWQFVFVTNLLDGWGLR